MARNFRTNLILGGNSRDGIRAMRTFRGEMDRVDNKGRQVQRRFTSMNRASQRLNRNLLRVGGTLASAFAVGSVVRGFSRLADEADRIGKTAGNIGVAAEFLQELRGAGELAGTTIQDIDDSVRRFNRRLGLFITDGTGPAAKSIEQLGLRVLDAQGNFRGTEPVLLDAIDAISRLPSVAEQAAQASLLFGDDAGPKLVNLISQGSEGVEELRQQVRDTGSVMSNEAVAAAEEYADATNLLGKQVRGVGLEIAEGLLPGLTATFQAMRQTSEATDTLSGFGEGLATSFNVVVRAGIIVRETLLAIGEVALGLGVTVVGAFRQIIAPIEGTVRTLAQTTQALLDGEFAQAAQAVKGIGAEIQTAFSAAQEQTERGIGFIGESIETRVTNTIEGVNRVADALNDVGQAGEDAGNTIGPAWEDVGGANGVLAETEQRTLALIDAFIQLGPDAAAQAVETARSFSEVRDALIDQIVQARGAGDALSDYQREQAQAAAVAQAGVDPTSQMADMLRQLAGAAFDAERALDGAGDATERFGALSQIGSNFASAVLNGQGVQSALGSSLTAFGGQGIAQFLDQNLGQFFETAFKDGLSAAFEDTDFQRNSAQGFALAMGQAVEGNLGQAAFTAAGNAIAGPIGALIGSIIGDAIFGESVPKFQVRGRNASTATDAGTDRVINTAFGAELEIAFRGIEDQAKRQIIRGYSDFLGLLSGVIRDPGQQSAIADVISRFGVSSRSGPDDIEGQLELLLDDILGTFDSFTREFVNVADTLEGRVQRLADIFQVQNRLILGQGFGLDVTSAVGPAPGPGPGNPIIIDPANPGPGPSPFPGEGLPGERIGAASQAQAFGAVLNGVGDAASVTNPQLRATLELLDDLRIGSEALGQTFDRLSEVTGALDRAAGLAGTTFADTREGVVRFGAELVAIFGDDAGAFSGLLNRVLEAAFSDEELAQQTIATARQRATDLLTGIGISVTEETFSQGGLRSLLEDFLGNLDPEDTASLLAAGDAIATILEAEQQLADARNDGAEAARNAARVGEILAGLRTEAARAGLEGLDLALFDLAQRQDQVIDSLEDAGATAAELAEAEALFGAERQRITDTFHQQALEAERRAAEERIRAQEEAFREQNQFMQQVGLSALRTLAPARAEYAQLEQRIRASFEQASQLTDAEAALTLARRAAEIETQQFIAALREGLASNVERLFGDGGSAIETVGQAINTTAQAADNFRDQWLRVVDQIHNALDAQLLDTSTLTAAERQQTSEQQFLDALAAAQAGDLDAAQQLTQLFNQAIGEGAGFFGATTDDFGALEARLRAALESANLPVPPDSPQQQTATNTAATAQAVQNVELSAFEQIGLATELIDQIGLLSQLTDDQPSAIGQEFGVPIDELIRILTGEVPDLTGDALATYFDDLVAETNAQLNELAQLEVTAASQLNTLNAIEQLAREQLALWQAFEAGGKFGEGLDPTNPEPFTATVQTTGGGQFSASPLTVPEPAFATPIATLENSLVTELRVLSARLTALENQLSTGNRQRAEHIAVTDGSGETLSDQLTQMNTELRRLQQRIGQSAGLAHA